MMISNWAKDQFVGEVLPATWGCQYASPSVARGGTLDPGRGGTGPGDRRHYDDARAYWRTVAERFGR